MFFAKQNVFSYVSVLQHFHLIITDCLTSSNDFSYINSGGGGGQGYDLICSLVALIY